jgi:hypothetical protein
MKIIHEIPEEHIGKARNQGNVESSHTVQCTHSSGSTNNVKVQNMHHGK